MPEHKAPSPSPFTDDTLALLFALGGETLAFYEVKSLAGLLLKHRHGKAAVIDETQLRDALAAHPAIVSDNGNYFSCHTPNLCLLAIEFLSQPENAPLVRHIANTLPATDALSSSQRLTRDIRNTLFAKDFKAHIACVEKLYKERPEDFATGRPYHLLADPIYHDWLASLPTELLSVCIRLLFPYMISRFKPIQFLLDLASRQFRTLLHVARLPVIDALIACGRFEQANDCLQSLVNSDPNTLQTRYGWLDLIHGNLEAALGRYNDAFENLRRNNYGNDIFFTTITGVFYIFALIKDNSPNAIGTARACTRAGFTNPLYANIYKHLHAYIEHTSGRQHFQRTDAPDAPPLDRLIADIIEFWLNEGQPSAECRQDLLTLEHQAKHAGIVWLEREIHEINRRLAPDWIPGALPCDAQDTIPLIDCVQILPAWTRELNDIARDLTQQMAQKPTRVAWNIAFSPHCPTNVQLELSIQHLKKTDRWTKGQLIKLDKLERDLKLTQEWPSYFTTQDIKAASMLMQLTQRQSHDLDADSALGEDSGSGSGNASASADVDDATACVSHNDILLSLLDYPRLYWKGDPTQTPVRIILEDPYIQILKAPEQARVLIRLFPSVAPKSHLAAVRYDDNSLHLFCFRQLHKRLLKTLKDGILIPEQAVSQLNGICGQLARLMKVKSDYGLDSLQVPLTQVVTPRPVMRLERTATGLAVELLMQPFSKDEVLRRPGEGAMAILEYDHDRLIRKQRDRDGEQQLIVRILEACPMLSSINMTAPYQWLVENDETAWQLLIQLQTIADDCDILWKQGRKFAVSRRISFGDVAMRARLGTQWLEIDGDVAVSDDLIIPFQKLLELAKEQKHNFIQLNDEQIIYLADDFKASLDKFNSIGQFARSKPQFNLLALPVLQMMLGDFDRLDISPEWQQQLLRIDEAKTLPVPPPQNLSPDITLRDYQLEGYRWLTRLDHWEAGACLADDMGLGKTIQTLAFIAQKAQEGPILIVAPTSVCANWADEIRTHTVGLEPPITFGQGNRTEALRVMRAGKIMISSYGLLQSQIASFEQIEWRVVVLDEAQAIKNYQAKRSQAALQLKAKFRIATTGTPIENNLGELWTLFQFITPGLFGSRQSFQDRFANPIERTPDSNALQQLNALIKPFLLRRKKDEVLKELPPKTEKSIHVYLSDEERAFYQALKQNLIREINENQLDDNTQQRIRILAAIQKLRQAACNPLLIEPGINVPSAKLEEFKRLISDLKECGHKTLVFSQFVKHLDIIRPTLKQLNISYEYLDGSTPTKDREEAVENFQNGNADAFLISLRAGGLGLNLTKADNVIILDPWWNPAVEDQAADRAHRIGQSRPVTIYRLIAHDTIEDMIIDLHNQKKDLAVQLLDGSDTACNLSADELYKLLMESR